MCSTAERERELACSSAADGRTVASITSAAPGCSGGARPAVTCAWYQRACGISSRTASCLPGRGGGWLSAAAWCAGCAASGPPEEVDHQRALRVLPGDDSDPAAGTEEGTR